MSSARVKFDFGGYREGDILRIPVEFVQAQGLMFASIAVREMAMAAARAGYAHMVKAQD